jgi:hypothetical protein
MKKVQIVITMLLITAIGIVSFKSKEATKYGGTASVTVKAGSFTVNCRDWSGKVKEGDTRVIEVSTSCTYSDATAAKTQLQQEIKYKMECYEKQTGSIDYDIDTCN